MKRWIPGLAVMVAALVGAASAQAQTSLRYKFKNGETLDYVLDQKINMTQDVAGMNIKTGVDQYMEMAWKVESVDDKGAAKIKMVFGRFKMGLDTPNGAVKLDSNDKEEPNDPVGKALYPVVKAISGLEMSVTMDPTGEMKDVVIPEKSAEKLKSLAGPGMGDMFSEDSLKKMVTQGLVFPAGEIEKGKSWNQKTTMKMPFGKMSVINDFTYQGSESKDGVTLEKIAVKPSVKLDADPNSKVAIKLKSFDGKGTILFDNKAGRVTQVTANQVMVIDVEANGVAVSQTIDTKSVMKLKTAK